MTDGDEGKALSEVRIMVRDNGSYRVEGSVTIVDHDGNEISAEGRERISLCRCGHSATKPFCDGTHRDVGFDAPSRPVAEGDPV